LRKHTYQLGLHAVTQNMTYTKTTMVPITRLNNKVSLHVHKPAYCNIVPTIKQVSHFAITRFVYIYFKKQPFPVSLVLGCVGDVRIILVTTEYSRLVVFAKAARSRNSRQEGVRQNRGSSVHFRVYMFRLYSGGQIRKEN